MEEHGIQIQGKHAVVVGHSNVVGKPMAAMLINRNALFRYVTCSPGSENSTHLMLTYS